jgi:hypothetical protein
MSESNIVIKLPSIGRYRSLDERIVLWKILRSRRTNKGCWLWQGHRSHKGYANVSYNKKSCSLHKLVWEHFNGKVPPKLQLDHLCRNRHCWNPDHLEPVTNQVNCQRGNTGQHFAKKTKCPKGHPYSEENTYKYRGSRSCLTCRRESARRRYHKING